MPWGKSRQLSTVSHKLDITDEVAIVVMILLLATVLPCGPPPGCRELGSGP